MCSIGGSSGGHVEIDGEVGAVDGLEDMQALLGPSETVLAGCDNILSFETLCILGEAPSLIKE